MEQLTFLDNEIEKESKNDTLNDEVEAKENQLVEKKAYKVKMVDVTGQRDREMAVFTHAKKLSEYIFVITEKSPKKLRWSIVSRLQNESINVIDNLYQANFVVGQERLNFQNRAKVSLCLLDYFTETAKRMQAITTRQMLIIGKQIVEVKKLLAGWIKSSKK